MPDEKILKNVLECPRREYPDTFEEFKANFEKLLETSDPDQDLAPRIPLNEQEAVKCVDYLRKNGHSVQFMVQNPG